MSVIPAFRKLRQEDQEFETSLGYIYSKMSSQEEKMIDLKVAASADRGVSGHVFHPEYWGLAALGFEVNVQWVPDERRCLPAELAW